VKRTFTAWGREEDKPDLLVEGEVLDDDTLEVEIRNHGTPPRLLWKFRARSWADAVRKYYKMLGVEDDDAAKNLG